MDIVSVTLDLINSVLSGVFVSVLVIIIAKFFLKEKIHTQLSLKVICILLITQAALWIILLLGSLLFYSLYLVLGPRAFGAYWWAYWIMLTLNIVLPLTLLIKKLADKKIYLLFVTIFMNIGWIIESYIVHMTSIEHEYMNGQYNPYMPTYAEISFLVRGFVFGVVLLVIENLIKKNRKLKAE